MTGGTTSTHGHTTLHTASEAHGTGAGTIIHGTAAYGLITHGITEDSMILGTTAEFTIHGIMADSTTHGSTAAITILGTLEDSTTHGITADSTDRTTTDGTEDGIRSGLDIIRDITLHLTIMAKM